MKNPNKLEKKAAFSKWRNGTSVTTTEFSFTKWDNNQKMLFDLKKDPQENENIAENPIYMEKVEELSEQCQQYTDVLIFAHHHKPENITSEMIVR